MRLYRLERCPECDDPLAQPEGVTRCPQCGFAYDRNLVAFRPRRPGVVYLPVGIALVFSPSVYSAVEMLLHGGIPRFETVLFAAITLTLLAWMAPRWRCLAFGGRRYVALSGAGIQARTTRGLQVIEWDDVAGLAILFGVPILLRHGAGRECRLEWIFDSDAEVADFRATLEHGRLRFQSPRVVSLRPGETLPPPSTDRVE